MDYKKNFKSWIDTKERVQLRNVEKTFFNEGEIWWCYLGVNIGIEQDGKGDDFMRPVLIIKKFSPNASWILPISQKEYSGNFFKKIQLIDGTYRTIALHQMKLVDHKRLLDLTSLISKTQIVEIKKALCQFLT